MMQTIGVIVLTWIEVMAGLLIGYSPVVYWKVREQVRQNGPCHLAAYAPALSHTLSVGAAVYAIGVLVDAGASVPGAVISVAGGVMLALTSQIGKR